MNIARLLFFMLALPLVSVAQDPQPETGSCFGRSNRASISEKMQNLLVRVSAETGCAKDKITYSVDEYYTGFYSRACRHLPKRITFDACGEKRSYMHNGLSGAVLHWLLGSWSLDKK